MSEELNEAWQYVNRPKLVGNDRKPENRKLIEPITVDVPTMLRIEGYRQAIIDAFYRPDIQPKVRPLKK